MIILLLLTNSMFFYLYVYLWKIVRDENVVLQVKFFEPRLLEDRPWRSAQKCFNIGKRARQVGR